MKNSLVIVAFWQVLSPTRAQSEPGIALKGGLNAATFAEDNRVNRYGFSGGFAGLFRRSLTDRFLLAGQADLLYTPRGAETVFEGEYLGQAREHYIDLMLALRPEAQLGTVTIYLLLGGGLNFLLSANKEDPSGVREDITGDLHRIDVALLAGAGIALQLPSGKLGPFHLGTVFLEGRHDHGLVDTPLIEDGGFKNRSTSLMLGLSFTLSSGAAAPPLRSDQPVAAALAGNRR